MAKIKVRRQIEIERNVVEQSLMTAKDLFKSNRKAVLISFAGALVLVIIIIAGFVVYDNVSESNRAAFEKIMEDHKKFSEEKNSEKIMETSGRLKQFIDSTSLGFAHEMAYYSLGNILYSEKKFWESREYLLKFADRTSSEMFKVLAMLKAAYASEETGDLDEAVRLYLVLEKDYVNSIVEDQVYYNLGRIYEMKGDVINSRKYYNRLITTFPQSLLSAKAKERLFLISKSAR